MSSKPVSAAAAVHCCLLSTAAVHCRLLPAAVVVVAVVRVFEQLTVSDRQLILLKLCMSVCALVFGCGSES